MFAFILNKFESFSSLPTVETNSRLLTRLVTQRSQTVNPTWFNDSYTTDDHSLQYSYRVICDVNFYGSRCTRKCLPRDDITGHYSCLPDGSRQCLPGWSGNRCTTRESLFLHNFAVRVGISQADTWAAATDPFPPSDLPSQIATK